MRLNNEKDVEVFYTHHQITVDKGQQTERIDKFLFNKIERISRNKIQHAAKAGCLLVNEKSVKQNYKVKPGDHIRLVLPKPPENHSLQPEDIPLEIVYEDDDLLVINKPVGMVVHPGIGNFNGTLANALAFHIKNLPYREQNPLRPGIVHRIDKNTSGLLVVAKTDYALMHLAKQFFNKTVKRNYWALVWGQFDEEKGTIKGHIARDKRFRKLFTVFPDGDYGKQAVTHYRVLKQFGYISLVECTLETGRTHQIRVHMKHIGHPLFGDVEYGGNKIVTGTVHAKYKQFVHNILKDYPHQALHAKSLGFEHPENGNLLMFEAPLPKKFHEVLNRWKKYINTLKN